MKAARNEKKKEGENVSQVKRPRVGSPGREKVGKRDVWHRGEKKKKKAPCILRKTGKTNYKSGREGQPRPEQEKRGGKRTRGSAGKKIHFRRRGKKEGKLHLLGKKKKRKEEASVAKKNSLKKKERHFLQKRGKKKIATFREEDQASDSSQDKKKGKKKQCLRGEKKKERETRNKLSLEGKQRASHKKREKKPATADFPQKEGGEGNNPRREKSQKKEHTADEGGERKRRLYFVKLTPPAFDLGREGRALLFVIGGKRKKERGGTPVIADKHPRGGGKRQKRGDEIQSPPAQGKGEKKKGKRREDSL